jgi:hypothetical protein
VSTRCGWDLRAVPTSLENETRTEERKSLEGMSMKRMHWACPRFAIKEKKRGGST